MRSCQPSSQSRNLRTTRCASTGDMTRSPFSLGFAVLIAGALFAGPKATQMPQAGPQPVAGMVLVPVTVTDSLGRSVTGLDLGPFRLYEDKIEQKVSLQSRDLPLSVGIVLDTSSSMDGQLERSQLAVSEFLKIALIDPADEAFLVEFSDRPALVQGFTHDRQAIESQVGQTEAKGNTALYDAIYLGLTEMEKAKSLRKALVVISDGMNHGSVYSGSQVADLAKKSGVEIYSVGLAEAGSRQRDYVSLAGLETLRQLSEPTGGRNFEVDNLQELPDVVAKIALNLRDQYLLAYTPTNQAHDGRFRKITVKLDSSAGVESPHAFSKSDYYAPAH